MKKLITLFTILTLVLAVPIPTGAAVKTDKRPVITTTNKSVKIKKVKSGTYKTTLDAGTKRIALKAKVSGKNVTKKCKWRSSHKKVATVTKTGKLTVKNTGKTNIIVIYKDKKTVLKVTVKDEEDEEDTEETPSTCKHDWEPHWVTETAVYTLDPEVMDAQGITVRYTCPCLREFYSWDEMVEHMKEVKTKEAVRNAFLKDPIQKCCGKHSDFAESICVEDDIMGPGAKRTRTLKYVDYFTCKLCGKIINEDGWMN